MEIRSLGHASFRLTTRGASLVTDPFDEVTVGLKFPKVAADIVTVSHAHNDHDQVNLIKGNPVVVSGPGEYEIKGVRITGIASYHDDRKGNKRGKNTIYCIKMEGINLLHCGDLGHKFSDHHLEALPDIDILFLPVGGYYTIDSTVAVHVVGQLEPKIVVPMHYRRPGLTKSLADRLEAVNPFIRKLGKEVTLTKPKLVISKSKLPEELEVVVLES